MVAPWLSQAVSPEPLLAWLRFLAVWAQGTQGGVAADRYAEVEQMLDRATQLSPDVRTGADFARACHLRLARQSPATDDQRDALLARAAQLRTADIRPASALGLLGEVELYCGCGHYARACAACGSAWDAGASGDAVLPIWRDALTRWSHTIRNDESTAWQDASKRLRIAATSHS